MSINPDLNILETFFVKNYDKLKSVADRDAHPEEELKRFYLNVFNRIWTKDVNLAYRLIQYLNQNQIRINRSLGQINTSRTRSEESQLSEYKIRNSKPFFKSVGNDKSELSYEFDAVYPINEKQKITFQKPKQNENPDLKLAREYQINAKEPFTIYLDEEKMKLIPSNARNINKAINLGLTNYKYWDHFIPTLYKYDFYKKDEGKKHVGMPGTWMFDLMYFSNYGKKNIKNEKLKYKQAIYLIGININTRFAVGRRINGKSVQDLIPPFEDLLKNELKDNINLLIFDGEKAISSKVFESFCNQNKINVRITYPGIHTQTAPIDRLCRTLRDYYSKMYMSKIKNGSENNLALLYNKYKRNKWLNKKEFEDALTTEAIYTRHLFNGEHKSYLPPIPSKYISYEDDDDGPYKTFLYEDEKEIESFKKYYRTIYYGDELYDVINYYNNKPHHGLIKILKYASNLFKVPIKLDDKEITPNNIKDYPALELLIIKYCHYYNKNLVKKSKEYRIGDKVEIYNCFNTERGKLKRNSNETLMGDWEIVSKDNEIYGVYNNVDKRLLHVSKYMIKPN